MRKSLYVGAVVAAFMAIAPLAQAESKFYVGGNVVRMTDKGDEAPAIHPLALSLRGGVEFNRYLSLEARYSKGIESDEGTVTGITFDLELEYLYGVYAKGVLPIGRFSPYAMVGYSKGKETATVEIFDLVVSDSDKGFSFGLGVDFPLGDNVSLNAEWTRFVEGEDDLGVGFKIEGLTVGVAMRF